MMSLNIARAALVDIASRVWYEGRGYYKHHEQQYTFFFEQLANMSVCK